MTSSSPIDVFSSLCSLESYSDAWIIPGGGEGGEDHLSMLVKTSQRDIQGTLYYCICI